MKRLFLAGAALGVLLASPALAQQKTIKLGVLTDMSGPYADVGGAGSVLAAQLAVEESGLAAKGWKIDIVSADHQNKVDIASNIAREWFDQGKADVVLDALNEHPILLFAVAERLLRKPASGTDPPDAPAGGGGDQQAQDGS